MFFQIKSQQELSGFLDEIIQAIQKMVQKNGTALNTAEGVVKMICQLVGQPSCYLLIHTDDMVHLNGVIFAVSIVGTRPAVEFIAMWTRPSYAKKIHREADKMFSQWAIEQGAERIIAGLTRAPAAFFKWFHKELGYEVIGTIIGKELKNVSR